MLKDEFGQCVACYFDPCRCFGVRQSEDKCSHCAEMRNEVAALRSELKRLAAIAELEKDRRQLLEKDLLLNRTVQPVFRGGSA